MRKRQQGGRAVSIERESSRNEEEWKRGDGRRGEIRDERRRGKWRKGEMAEEEEGKGRALDEKEKKRKIRGERGWRPQRRRRG